MDPILISNQVYQAIQLDTLEEPIAKSTILYANKYSGIGEIPLSDPELLSVLNSTVGNSGNNILVQLKQKMSAFRNGPWYIDSKDGCIYIHNRKYSDSSVYNYTYNAENGELLMASFRMVEVNRGIEGFSGFVNAITKAISALDQKLERVELGDPPLLQEPVDMYDPDHKTGNRFSTYVSPELSESQINTQLDIQARARKSAEEVKKKREEFDAKSKEERGKAYWGMYDRAYKSTDKSQVNQWMMTKHPVYKLAWDYYQDCIKYYGANSKEATLARERLDSEASKIKAPIQDLEEHWNYFSVKLSAEHVDTNNVISEQKKQEIIQRTVNNYIKTYGKKKRITDPKTVNVRWKVIDSNTYRHTAIGGFMYTAIHQVTFTLNYWGYSNRRATVRGDRLIKDLINDRKASTDPAKLISNAAANMGRRKHEKRLQAMVRTIGNPILETGMQIELQNVGNKQSGLWYIHQVSHSLEHGQGYICDMILSRQSPKNGSKGAYSEIHTQAYTTETEEPNPNNAKLRKSAVGNTSNKPRPKANVVSTNKEYTYQDALNEPLTVEEVTYVRTRANLARSESEKNSIIREEIFNIADIKYMNKTQGTNKKYVNVSKVNDKTGEVKINKSNVIHTTKVKRTSGTSQNFDYLRKTTNIRKGK